MRPTKKNISRYTLPMPTASWSLLVLVIALHFLLTFEEKKPIAYILTNWGYYRAMLFSLAVAVVLIFWVRYQAIKLDKSAPWTENFNRRLQLQALHGLLLPLIFAIFFVAIYFAVLDINVLRTVYFRRHLPLIGLFLLIFNLLVLVWYLYFKRRPYLNHSKLMVVVQDPALGADIACVYIKDGQCFYHDLKGQLFLWTSTLKEAVDKFEGYQFFEVRRGFLVNRSVITAVKPEGTCLKITLSFVLSVPIVVSNRKRTDFKHWLAQGEGVFSI